MSTKYTTTTYRSQNKHFIGSIVNWSFITLWHAILWALIELNEKQKKIKFWTEWIPLCHENQIKLLFCQIACHNSHLKYRNFQF